MIAARSILYINHSFDLASNLFVSRMSFKRHLVKVVTVLVLFECFVQCEPDSVDNSGLEQTVGRTKKKSTFSLLCKGVGKLFIVLPMMTAAYYAFSELKQSLWPKSHDQNPIEYESVLQLQNELNILKQERQPPMPDKTASFLENNQTPMLLAVVIIASLSFWYMQTNQSTAAANVNALNPMGQYLYSPPFVPNQAKHFLLRTVSRKRTKSEFKRKSKKKSRNHKKTR